ncbi:MAG: hypothetical protein AAF682_11880 [Planctomycetota bacterium]
MRTILPVAVLTAASGWAGAQSTIVVHPSGTDPMTGGPAEMQIQAAISMAVPGDEIVVYPQGGTGYDPFLLGLSGVTIRAAEVGPLNRPEVRGGDPLVLSGRCAVLAGSSLIRGLVFVGGAATDNGGGVQIVAGSPELQFCRVEGCTSTGQGGGIYVGPDATPAITSTEVVNNRSSLEGGGIAIDSNHTLLTSLDVSGNVAQDADNGYQCGGGIYVRALTCDVLDSRIYENEGAAGGGICWDYFQLMDEVNFPFLVLSDTDLEDNISRSGEGGGGLYSDGVTVIGAEMNLNIDNCRFLRNQAQDGSGGGLFLGERVNLAMDYGLVQDNTARERGGGLASDSPESTRVTNSVFDLNRAGTGPGEGGGAVNITGADVLSGLGADDFINVLFVENRGTAKGGGVALANSTVRFRTCTWSKNVARDSAGTLLVGGALFADGTSTAVVDTCILYDDVGALDTALGSAEIGTEMGATITVRYSALDAALGTSSVVVTPAVGNPFVVGAGTVSPIQANQSYYLDRDAANPAALACLDAGNPALLDFPSQPPYVTATTDPAATPIADGAVGDLADMGFHYGGTPLPPVLSLLEPVEATVMLGGSVTYTLTSSASPLPGAVTSRWYLGGSVTGTHPSTPFGTILLPLVFDGYSQALVIGTGFFFETGTSCITAPSMGAPPPQGSLPAIGGAATIDFCVPATTSLPLPVTLWHAFFVADYDASDVLLGFRHPSNPARVIIQ